MINAQTILKTKFAQDNFQPYLENLLDAFERKMSYNIEECEAIIRKILEVDYVKIVNVKSNYVKVLVDGTRVELLNGTLKLSSL